MPWPSAPSVTAASPVSTPARARSAGRRAPPARPASTRSSAARTARSASSSCATGRAPDGHDRVADELLDRAAVALDHRARSFEVAGQELARLLGVAALGERREADEVGEQHRDEPALGSWAPSGVGSAGAAASERRAALAAELHRRAVRRAAGRAGRRARCRTRRRTSGPARSPRRRTGTDASSITCISSRGPAARNAGALRSSR